MSPEEVKGVVLTVSSVNILTAGTSFARRICALQTFLQISGSTNNLADRFRTNQNLMVSPESYQKVEKFKFVFAFRKCFSLMYMQKEK